MSDISYHMTPDEFRKYGHELIEWIARYQENVAAYPVRSQVQPGEVRAMLPTAPPEQGEAMEAILADVDRIIMPGITHWQSPNMYGYFPSNNSGASILGELLSAGLGVQGMLWVTSPACTEVETHMLDWLVQMMGLPQKFLSSGAGGGVLQDSASSGTLCALLAARERFTKLQTNKRGLAQGSGALVAYTSSQAHSSLEKGVRIAGIGSDNLRLIEVDEKFAMRADRLAEQIAADRAAGLQPFFVMATIGTTSSMAIDPLPEIAEIAAREGLWLHVDSAMAGTAAICPEFRHYFEGLEGADSYLFNPHKWMFTNFDADCFYVADRAALIQALSILPEYLRNAATADGAVIDYRDWQVPLGRRFRALKLWFVIRQYGIEGLRHHVRRHVAITNEFVRWVSESERFELAAPPELNLVCFRCKAGDEASERLLHALNESGKLYLTHTKLDGKFVLRMSIGQTHTELHHLEEVWSLMNEFAAQQ